jgi:hypothetical protein
MLRIQRRSGITANACHKQRQSLKEKNEPESKSNSRSTSPHPLPPPPPTPSDDNEEYKSKIMALEMENKRLSMMEEVLNQEFMQTKARFEARLKSEEDLHKRQIEAIIENKEAKASSPEGDFQIQQAQSIKEQIQKNNELIQDIIKKEKETKAVSKFDRLSQGLSSVSTLKKNNRKTLKMKG